MEGALGWISAIAEWVGQFIPRWVVVPATHGAVKFVRGSQVVNLGPGVHFYWPLVTVFVLHPVAEQTTDLPAQTITTGDGRSALVRGMVAYEVDDLEALIARNFDPDDSIRDIAGGVIHDVCAQYATWGEFYDAARDRRKLSRTLLAETAAALKPYGVKVLRVSLLDLALCRVYRVVAATDSASVVRG